MNIRYNVLFGALALAAVGLSGCKDGLGKYDNSWLLDNDETMTLEASATSVKLDVNALDEEALTFTWTPAREMSDEYVLSYVTMLDMKTNEFNSSSVVRTLEDDGVYEKSYTNLELQNLIVDKWGKSISEVSTLSFKVIAKWEGGSKYVMPEVRTVDVDIQPYRPITFDADKVFLDGEAVKDVRPSSNYTMTKTPENEFIYAGEFLMKAGRMTIPIQYDGLTRYIVPDTKQSVDVPDNDPVDGVLTGTEEYAATVMDIPEGSVETDLPAWNLPSEGFWRVIIDMENKTVKFFSPKNRLEPLTVQFNYAGSTDWILSKTLVGGVYYVNTMTGWDSWKGKPFDFVASQIDPQLLICQGVSISLSEKFCIKTGQALSEGYTVVQKGTTTGENDPTVTTGMKFVSKTWTFVPEGNVDAPMAMNKWLPMTQTVSNTKWTFEGSIKISKITVDLRNNRIRFD